MNSCTTLDDVRQGMRQHWGYDTFRPLQERAIEAVLAGRDSVVVMPTGGGKSLCFQAPAACLDGLAVVVSPLISLMKDQVDALRANGVAAACVNSTLTPAERREVAGQIRAGQLRMLYVAPERLVTPRMLDFLQQVNVSFFAIDEAHCISSWGHDFRPEYRALAVLRERFADIAIHAYTATATERVRGDMVEQLHLRDPCLLVGSFDRPNLVYRVRRRAKLIDQIREILDQHPQESGIIYTISRKDAEKTSAALTEWGYRAAPYHAGMDDRARHRHQEQFLREEIDVIVATVAFGMGIDKSNVRFVIHAGMPKSVEAYHQESGRAGRDGLEAECTLFYSPGDLPKWLRIIESDGAASTGERESLEAIYQYCGATTCRHRMLVGHFGQNYEQENCGSCDVCLEELEYFDDALIVSQKILSCVARLQERYGAEYTALVLVGSQEERITRAGHQRLSTYGLLAAHSKRVIREWIEQLVGGGYLVRVGEYHVLNLTDLGWQVLRGEHTPRLLQPTERKTSRSSQANWEGVDRGLFESLRELRRELAEEREVPAYVVFGDAALREMARLRPSDVAGFRLIKGVGDRKCEDYAEVFLARIGRYAKENDLDLDV